MDHVDRTEEQAEAKYIKGELVHTIFHNSEEQFTIAKIRIEETNEPFDEKEIVIKGYFSSLQEGERYVFSGELIKHPKFGTQYQVEQYKTFIPETREGLIDYLSSDLFYGVGAKTAERIIDHLGENAIDKILADESVLLDVPNLKKETAITLAETLRTNQGFEQIVVYLSRYQIGLKLAQKIYKAYQDQAVQLLEEDPYQFVYDIEGFGFQTADNIARQNGLDEKHPNRIGAGCMFVLQRSTQEGHVYLPIDICIERVLGLLKTRELTAEEIKERLVDLNLDKTLITANDHVYLPSLYVAESGFVGHLERIMETEEKVDVDLAELMKLIGEIEEEDTIQYGKEQFNAIEKALKSKVMILTGGPGTGKTTVVKGIIKAYARLHELSLDIGDYDQSEAFPFVLAAPTGRAAKRLNESTGLPAVTVHRLLGWDGRDGFDKNEHEKLAGKILIIDEFSMVDTWLAYHLFRAIPSDMQVLIVGDEDQLPSVGPGQVLTDLLSSDRIPSVTLDEVYRQKEGSRIIQIAHEMKHGTMSKELLNNDKDFSFIPCGEPYLLDAITQIFERASAKGIDLRDIQVLAPIYRSQAGINQINKKLQELINPKSSQKREVSFIDVTYRTGDKVIQLVNQPEDGIYNGDIGEVVAIFKPNENVDKVEQLVVLFDDKEVVYERKDYNNLMHAYCISIHKSQGSEFSNVILPVASSYVRMLKKNLLYTAITRSKKSLIICGNADAFLRGIEQVDTNTRYTTLKELLGPIDPEVKAQQFMTPEEEEDALLTPYDFM